MMNRWYERTKRWSASKFSGGILALISFSESSFFPIPPDPLMMMLTALHPRRWWRYATLTFIFSVAGGLFGYVLGFAFYEFVGRAIIEAYQLEEAIAAVQARYEANAFLAVFGAAFTPIPYKVFTISAGLFHINVFTFLVASFLGRGIRFFAIAFLMYMFGERMETFIKKYFGILSFAFFILIVLGFIVIKYIF